MQSNSRIQQLHRFAETAVNGEVIHKMNLVGMVRVCGVHSFNVYRRYNNVFEIVIEDCNGDFYLQRDQTLRDSIGDVMCLSNEQKYSMYTVDLFSFRHGGVPPVFDSAPENMTWSEIQQEWYAIDINLRGFLEECYEDDVSSDECSSECSDCVSDEDETSDELDEMVKEEEDEEDYSDMPPLIDDSEDESEPQEESEPQDESEPQEEAVPNGIFFHYHFLSSDAPTNKKRRVSDSDDDYIILRNGTKYRKVQ